MPDALISILTKVKKLLNLATSANPNEATIARAIADKLMAKYNITEVDVDALDPKEYYVENEKLFFTMGISNWRQQLAVAVAGYFDCHIVQEKVVPMDGLEHYTYFVYGNNDQVKDVQFVYHAFAKKVIFLVDFKCIGRGPVYIESYCDGVIDSVKWNIEMYGIDLPDIRRPLKQEELAPPPNFDSIVKSGSEKENPTDNRIDINKGKVVKDILAYFKGVDDGKNLSLADILELESQNIVSKELTNEPK